MGDGIHLARVVPFYYQFAARQLPLGIQKHIDVLSSQKVVYVDRELQTPGTTFTLIPLDNYREHSASLAPFSGPRVDALIRLAQSRNGVGLASCVEPCFGRKLHLLCIYFTPIAGEEIRLLPGLAQIE